MSPHNHARFNGSNLHSKASYHNGQNELGLAMEKGLSKLGGLLYTYSGLGLFRSRRLFERGIPEDQLSLAITDGIK